MAQWLWRLQSDTLGSSPTVVGFLLSPFSQSGLDSNDTFINVKYCMHIGIYVYI